MSQSYVEINGKLIWMNTYDYDLMISHQYAEHQELLSKIWKQEEIFLSSIGINIWDEKRHQKKNVKEGSVQGDGTLCLEIIDLELNEVDCDKINSAYNEFLQNLDFISLCFICEKNRLLIKAKPRL